MKDWGACSGITKRSGDMVGYFPPAYAAHRAAGTALVFIVCALKYQIIPLLGFYLFCSHGNLGRTRACIKVGPKYALRYMFLQ